MKPRVYLVAVTEQEWRRVCPGRSLRALMDLGLSLERRIAERVRIGVDRDLYDRTCRALEEGVLLACGTSVGRREILQYSLASAYMELATRLSDWRQTDLAPFAGILPEARGPEAAAYAARRTQPMGKSFYPAGWPVRQQWSVFAAITEQYAAVLLRKRPQADGATARDLAAAARTKAAFCHGLAGGAALVEAVTLEPY
jgi:hypothetical protein